MVKFTCPGCGYSMQTAQYLNGKGHCLKCQAVVASSENHPLNPEWVKKMKTKFDALNSDGKANKGGFGTLTEEEMGTLLRKGNPCMGDGEIKTLFDAADENGNGVIEFTEFLWFLYGGKDSGSAPKGSRAPGEASSSKPAASSAGESASGVCPKADGGPHQWKYGKCNLCQMPEGKIAKGPAAFGNPGGKGGAECEKGGKCTFKFSQCTKCKKRE